MHYVVLLATPLVLYFIIFAREGIILISGNAFIDAVLPMRIIMPTVILIGITNILGIQMLVPLGKEKVVLKSEIAGACIDLILNLLLIPRMMAAGATIGTLFAEMAVLIVQARELREDIKSFIKNFKWTRLCGGLLISLGASFWTKYLSISGFLILIISSILFFGTYFTLMIIQKDEIVIAVCKQLLARVRRENAAK